VANTGLVRIDLNHDGIADFALSNTWKSTSSEIFKNLWVQNLRPANEIRAWLSGYSTSAWCAAALPRGTKVGPKGQFHVGPLPMPDDGFRGPKFCPWLHVRHAYLGLKFVIKGKTHFGWVRVKLTLPPVYVPITATLTGYAYETNPWQTHHRRCDEGSRRQRTSRIP
jgi:hypothetical protein